MQSPARGGGEGSLSQEVPSGQRPKEEWRALWRVWWQSSSGGGLSQQGLEVGEEGMVGSNGALVQAGPCGLRGGHRFCPRVCGKLQVGFKHVTGGLKSSPWLLGYEHTGLGEGDVGGGVWL